MVSVSFESRLPHPPTLALIKHLASIDKLPEEVEYIGKDGFEAVRAMQLVNRGRLSKSLLLSSPGLFRLIPGVQPVTDEAYEAVVKLGTQGGWEDLVVKPSKAKAKVATQSKAKANAEAEIGTSPVDQVKEEVFEKESKKTHKAEDKKATRAKAARPPTPTPTEGTRRSKRVKVEH
jgi:protein phosphatase-4 regulatory subunit 3